MSSALFLDLKTNQDQTSSLSSKLKKVSKELYDACFPKQRNVLDDPYPRIAVRTPRRCGKTYTAGTKVSRTHCRHKDAWTAIICLTQGSARRLYWKWFKDLDSQYGLGLKFNKNTLEIDWPNGGKTILIGADKRSEIDKLRGLKLHGVVFDEAKSYSVSILQELMEEVVEPALLDFGGWLLMIGTPGSVLAGTFYQATCLSYRAVDKDGKSYRVSRPYWERDDPYWKDQEPQWSFHTWTQQDNIYLVNPETGEHQWESALRTKKRNKWDDDHPSWVREYLGEWAVNEDALVYPYSVLKSKFGDDNIPIVQWRPNLKSTLPFGLPDKYPLSCWTFMFGVDYGYEDDTGACVVAYNQYESILYQVWSTKEHNLLPRQVADIREEALSYLPAGCRFDIEIFDTGGGASKGVMMELNQEWGCQFIAADKKNKFDYIQLVGDYMHSGQIKVLADGDLALEMELLQWDLEKGKKGVLADLGKLKEDPQCPNHACDAFLYVFKWWYKTLAQVEKQVEVGSTEWYDLKEKQEIERLTLEHNGKKNKRIQSGVRALDVKRRTNELKQAWRSSGGWN